MARTICLEEELEEEVRGHNCCQRSQLYTGLGWHQPGASLPIAHLAAVLLGLSRLRLDDDAGPAGPLARR